MDIEEHIRKVCMYHYDTSLLDGDHQKAQFLVPSKGVDYGMVGHSPVVLSSLPKIFPWIERPLNLLPSILENVILILPVTIQEITYHVLRLSNREEVLRDMDQVMYPYACKKVIEGVMGNELSSVQIEITVVQLTKLYVDDYLKGKYPTYRLLRDQTDAAITTYMAYLTRDVTHVHDESIIRFMFTIQNPGFRNTETGNHALDELYSQQLIACHQEKAKILPPPPPVSPKPVLPSDSNVPIPALIPPLLHKKKRKRRASSIPSLSHPPPTEGVSHSVE
jgi:hypothetical protein